MINRVEEVPPDIVLLNGCHKLIRLFVVEELLGAVVRFGCCNLLRGVLIDQMALLCALYRYDLPSAHPFVFAPCRRSTVCVLPYMPSSFSEVQYRATVQEATWPEQSYQLTFGEFLLVYCWVTVIYFEVYFICRNFI